uniref:Uncharacterized protein n=1 Tax=Rhizophora mucronata TaxID=61149 RepID=A0A2P2R480_RHIMU
MHSHIRGEKPLNMVLADRVALSLPLPNSDSPLNKN